MPRRLKVLDTFSKQISVARLEVLRVTGVNDAPTAAEARELRTLVAETEECIAALDESIDGEAFGQATVMRMRDQYIELIAAYRAALAPIRRLPVELLVRIFVLSRYYMKEFGGVTWSFSSASPKKAPLLLCQICTAWRTLALNIPILWAEMAFKAGHPTHVTGERLAMQQAWLGRTGTVPLSLQLTSYQYGDECSDDFVLTALLPSINRLQSLSLVVPEEQMRAVLALPQGSLDYLQRLTVYRTGALDAPCRLFSPASRLCKVELSDVRGSLSLLGLPWSRLTHLLLHDDENSTRPVDLINILPHCTALQYFHLELTQLPEDADPVPPVPAFAWPCLTTFCLSVVNPASPAVHALASPLLREPGTGGFDLARSRYQGFQFHLSPALRRLTLNLPAVTSDGIVAVLRVFPLLEMLELQYQSYYGAHLLEALTVTDNACLAPKLRKLKVHGVDIGEAFHERVACMVESRWWPDGASESQACARLGKFTLYCAPMRRDVKARLLKCKREGLLLKLTVHI